MSINLQNKKPGFYVGAAGALFAILTLIIYFAMQSMFFTGWVVAGLLAGVVIFAVQAVMDFPFLYVFSYAAYMFAFYHFMIREVEHRMDTLVDPAQGPLALDTVFYVISLTFLVCIIATIVASCMEQTKSNS